LWEEGEKKTLKKMGRYATDPEKGSVEMFEKKGFTGKGGKVVG